MGFHKGSKQGFTRFFFRANGRVLGKRGDQGVGVKEPPWKILVKLMSTINWSYKILMSDTFVRPVTK